MHMSSAVSPLPMVVARMSAGLRSVPTIRPTDSDSADKADIERRKSELTLNTSTWAHHDCRQFALRREDTQKRVSQWLPTASSTRGCVVALYLSLYVLFSPSPFLENTTHEVTIRRSGTRLRSRGRPNA